MRGTAGAPVLATGRSTVSGKSASPSTMSNVGNVDSGNNDSGCDEGRPRQSSGQVGVDRFCRAIRLSVSARLGRVPDGDSIDRRSLR